MYWYYLILKSEGMMTKKDYTQIIEFFRNEDTCFVVLRKSIGNTIFNEILQKTENVGLSKFLGDISSKGNIYFMKRSKKARPNCILIHIEDYPIGISTEYAMLLSKDIVIRKMEQKSNIAKNVIPKTKNSKNIYKDKEYLIGLDYDTFLRTDYWKEVRQEKLRQCGHK